MGIGLYTAKCIADLNEIELKLSSGDEIKKVKKGARNDPDANKRENV